MNKTLIFLLSFYSFTHLVNAQVSYEFTALSGAYTPITGGTIAALASPHVSLNIPDEGYANEVPIGFTFMYNGISYDSININVNGIISFGEGFIEDENEKYFISNLTSGPVSLPSARPIIAPFWADLYLTEDSITYVLTGSSPNRLLTVQWSKVQWDLSTEEPAISFQVKLYESTNVIEFIYKEELSALTSTASIGLTGTQIGPENFISLSNSSASPVAGKTEESEINARPATNQLYRFTPLACIAPSDITLTNVTTSSVTFTWNAVADAPGYEYAFSISATPPASGTFIEATTVNIEGLTEGVNNYLFVRTTCGGNSFSAWSKKAMITCTANILPANGAIVSKPPTISWNSVAGATGYIVMLGTNGINYTSIGTVPDSVTSTQIIDLDHDSTYFFYVRPFIGTDTALTLCESNATSFTIAPKPVIPCTTNTRPGNGDTADIPTAISFNKVAGATGYQVMLSSDSINYEDLGSVSDTFALLPLQNFSTKYYFYIRPVFGEDTASLTCQSTATSFITMARPAIPVNDSCGGAFSIIPGDSAVNGQTFSATTSPVAEICPATGSNLPSDPDDDLWYKFTTPASGSAVIIVSGDTFFDAVLSVYTGGCEGLTLLNCADSTFDGGTETLTLNNLQQGATYYARVYDYLTARPGRFTISITSGVLPVTMGELRGERLGLENLLSWSTQNELNNKGFEVQRSSEGSVFNTLDFVTSKASGGNSSTALHYRYTDKNPAPGNIFYRIRQSDKDGKFSHTNIAVLKALDISQLQLTSLYPNPSPVIVNLVIGSPVNNNIMLIVSDLAGKTVLQQKARLITGNNNLKINISKLSPGSYLIKAICEDGCRTAVRKFVKQ